MLRVESPASALRRNRWQGIQTANNRASARNPACRGLFRAPTTCARHKLLAHTGKGQPLRGQPSFPPLPIAAELVSLRIDSPAHHSNQRQNPATEHDQRTLFGRRGGDPPRPHSGAERFGAGGDREDRILKQTQTIRERNRQRFVRIRTPEAGGSIGSLR